MKHFHFFYIMKQLLFFTSFVQNLSFPTKINQVKFRQKLVFIDNKVILEWGSFQDWMVCLVISNVFAYLGLKSCFTALSKPSAAFGATVVEMKSSFMDIWQRKSWNFQSLLTIMIENSCIFCFSLAKVPAHSKRNDLK